MENILFSPRHRLDEDAERELGRRLEALWDEQKEPSLSDTQRLNSCLEKIPVSSFPAPPDKQVVEINSDASLAEAVQLLAKHKILSSPVRDINAPEDATWIDKYIGIVEFAGIAVWLLQQSEAFGINSGSEAAMGGDFFEMLTSSEFYRETKVKDISGSFRWAPFLPLHPSDSFLTMLLLLSKYRMKSLPVVDIGEGKIGNIVTQSAVVHMLSKFVGLPWFETWGNSTLSELGLPVMKPDQMVKLIEDQPVLQAFKLMSEKRVGGLPIIEKEGNKVVGNISLRDIQFLLMAPEIYEEFRSVTAKAFCTAVRSHLRLKQEASPLLEDVITCQKTDTIEKVILKLDNARIQRIYVVNSHGDLEGVVTLRDIISTFVQEPPGYFGDFFYQVVPLPINSSV
ncbi:SNF1-related protein kinase regulatory subunit gamma-1 isoform X1 [Cryptomeria japonica]|uniref:SNF1-related protein kinase regulatory subunit gamma-1 isoform X1 n=1 Tax=Cryptomeria japonica TaxID=3369 RepID=UPI0025AD995D|nr:SNF1-related protein kinase regulatory subunit gamma-1 isoform X1 [Cryptomeria japonica]